MKPLICKARRKSETVQKDIGSVALGLNRVAQGSGVKNVIGKGAVCRPRR